MSGIALGQELLSSLDCTPAADKPWLQHPHNHLAPSLHDLQRLCRARVMIILDRLDLPEDVRTDAGNLSEIALNQHRLLHSATRTVRVPLWYCVVVAVVVLVHVRHGHRSGRLTAWARREIRHGPSIFLDERSGQDQTRKRDTVSKEKHTKGGMNNSTKMRH